MREALAGGGGSTGRRTTAGPASSSSARWPLRPTLQQRPRLVRTATGAHAAETATAAATTTTTTTTTEAASSSPTTSPYAFPPMAPLPEGVNHSYHPYGRHGATISYYHSGARRAAAATEGGGGGGGGGAAARGAVVFVSGFGVGGWHYERNLPALARETGFSCFAPDLLGQGRSWPREHPAGPAAAAAAGAAAARGGGSEGEASEAEEERESGSGSSSEDGGAPLRYSVDEWVEQLRRFIVEVALPRSGLSPAAAGGGKVVLVGNSLGGFLAVQMAARHPELVRGVALLNATPFWAFQKRAELPVGGATGGGGWSWPPPSLDGRVPAPAPITAAIRRLWWDSLRRPGTVEALLAQVYANPAAFQGDGGGSSGGEGGAEEGAAAGVAGGAVTRRILEATEHPLAVDAFVSIALSPKPACDFDEALASPEARSVPFLLLYGALDPWVHPYWARRARRARPDAPLWLIEGAGHCPAHEAPTAVNASLARWVAWLERGGGFVGGAEEEGGAPPLAVGERWSFARGESALLPFEAETAVRSDPGEPTTAFGRLERLLSGGV